MGAAEGHAGNGPVVNALAFAPTDLAARRHLFYKTSHAPSLADLVGYERIGDILDFCFIANPYYPTPDMMKHLQDNLITLIKSYPSCDPAISRRYLADVLRVNPDRLVIGNGASELICVVGQKIIKTIGVPVPTFGEYLYKLRSTRAVKPYRLRLENVYQLNLAAYLAWVRKNRLKAALVINPGNPTGQLHPLDEMRDFLTSAQDLDVVVVDESFIDFAGDPPPSLLPCADEFKNLLIVRSMSKHCGVAGLRLGYCYSANDDMLERIRRALPTWNVNTLAEYFLSLLPSTDADYHAGRKRLIDDVRVLYEGLRDIPGLFAYPTGANFVLVRIGTGKPAVELQQQLLDEHQMYVRDCSNKVGMDGYHIRVASQGREKDRMLLAALRQIFSTVPHAAA